MPKKAQNESEQVGGVGKNIYNAVLPGISKNASISKSSHLLFKAQGYSTNWVPQIGHYFISLNISPFCAPRFTSQVASGPGMAILPIKIGSIEKQQSWLMVPSWRDLPVKRCLTLQWEVIFWLAFLVYWHASC